MARIEEVIAGDASWGEYALDVAGHAGLGTAYALPFVSLALFWFGWSIPSVIGLGCGVALFGGVVREVVQFLKSNKPVMDKLHWRDRTLDALHHLLGGPIALGILLGVRALI